MKAPTPVWCAGTSEFSLPTPGGSECGAEPANSLCAGSQQIKRFSSDVSVLFHGKKEGHLCLPVSQYSPEQWGHSTT